VQKDFDAIYKKTAELFDQLSEQHEFAVDLLEEAASDPKHGANNLTLAEAERSHADACRRAAFAIRSRKSSNKKNPAA
jgi:hypothetical protein